jgi:poly(hydroxyalkanoate) depolymerase family esterase
MRPSQFPPGIRRLSVGPLDQQPFSSFSHRLEEHKNFGDNPGALRMFAYVPPSMQPEAPLVVTLHGCGQTAANYEKGTGWTDLADQLGFAVLAPEQDRSNNINGCFNWFQVGDTARGHGEAASIHSMIEWMIQHRPVSRSQVFITGLSAGGAMTAAMLAAYPDVFAGGAIIAGLPFGAASNVPEAMNVMRHAPAKSARQWGDKVRGASLHEGVRPIISVWHGDADSTVHVSNSEASISQWIDVLGLELSDAQSEHFGDHQRSVWRARNGKVMLEAFRLSKMGHGAPVGGAPQQRYGQPGAYFIDIGISSTTHIAAFWGFAIKPVRNLSAAPADPGVHTWKSLPKNIGSTIAAALRSAGLLKS